MYRNTQTKMAEATKIILNNPTLRNWRELTTNPGMELLAKGGGCRGCTALWQRGYEGHANFFITITLFEKQINYPTKNAGSLEDCCPYLPLVITNLVKGRTPNHEVAPLSYILQTHGHSLQVNY
jgi:hypothetical protein